MTILNKEKIEAGDIDQSFEELFDPIERCSICSTPIGQSAVEFNVIVGLSSQIQVHRCPTCKSLYKGHIPNQALLDLIYDEHYVHFDASLQVSSSALESRLKRVASVNNTSNMRILDAGCGRGDIVAQYQVRGWQGYGIDPYAPLDVLDEDLKQYIIRDDITHGANYFGSESFDIITAWYVFEHLTAPNQFLTEMHRLLKPGGTAIILVPCADSLAAKRHQGAWKDAVLVEHLLFYSKLSFQHLARHAGFSHNISFRYAGTPYPMGKTVSNLMTQGIEQKEKSSITNRENRPPHTFKQNLIHRIHNSPTVGAFLRQLVHFSGIGDYIEAYLYKEA